MIPLSSTGLCEAEIITPAAASIAAAIAATAGVGTMPSCTTLRPVEAIPATIAPSSIGPDKRVSRPTTIGPVERLIARDHRGAGAPDRERELRRQVGVRHAAHAVGSEVFAHAASYAAGPAITSRRRSRSRRRTAP